MQTYHVALESHQSGATIYLAGILSDPAAIQTEEIIRALSWSIHAVRVDLRAVVYIDPESFVQVARAIRRWRDARNGRVTLEFPERSQPRQVARLTPTEPLLYRSPEVGRLALEC
jgi:hypothetical protein